jgi:hypothetical protein
VTKSTFVVLISIVNATSSQSAFLRLKNLRCVRFATLLQIAVPTRQSNNQRTSAVRQKPEA